MFARLRHRIQHLRYSVYHCPTCTAKREAQEYHDRLAWEEHMAKCRELNEAIAEPMGATVRGSSVEKLFNVWIYGFPGAPIYISAGVQMPFIASIHDTFCWDASYAAANRAAAVRFLLEER